MIDRAELTKVAKDYFRPLGFLANVVTPHDGDAPHEEGDVWLDVGVRCEDKMHVKTDFLVKKDATMEQVVAKFPQLVVDIVKCAKDKSLRFYIEPKVAAKA